MSQVLEPSQPFYFKGVRFYPTNSPVAMEMVESLEVRDDDVFVSAYLKSGTTWTQQIVSLVCADDDISEVCKVPLSERFPWLETVRSGEPVPKLLEKAPSPRLIKTHLPYHMLPQQAKDGRGKIIYCARNVKDVVVSWHNLRRMVNHLPCGTWEENFKEFITPELAYSGFWWDVIPEYWRHKDDGNMLFIKFEDMKRDLRGHVVKIATFLGRTLSDQRIDEVVANCTFSAMKENPATNFSRIPALQKAFFSKAEGSGLEFIRKGEVGDWKNWFSQEENQILETIHEEKMAGLDLTFRFE
ncbi:sulfotransferase 1C4-like isoform X3 [Branchiostoma floridae]|uniref:Sulfotransferase n=1 Tax=Branchiostoma floridae TaxID=7739 RepID=A0A9J7M3N1_BRAFL|nr:sulfotransferase 1C4-like isoform X3 [Branchiostoma floridae]XP_035693423.1 sulfotransferase 1C4-like isoform X3 [Branchiostoma floridae]XP_035693424.1 sulfotransferase 1C4-like isoform X3 [Branchiostoma floridae]XP_035693425.1 sulfotransferase 1C4-like isoform X3 [Branchiostoma floridae]XP_035693426.1 sulfotransferase 1C4-like isoform X3 [Branchiostoma floridae]XP_035693428.1 sulfotransferase 1C4-like isoform X3 [Branchiostoma floridae]